MSGIMSAHPQKLLDQLAIEAALEKDYRPPVPYGRAIWYLVNFQTPR
jgi:hypothetical protein